jgi:hypothetical protein
MKGEKLSTRKGITLLALVATLPLLVVLLERLPFEAVDWRAYQEISDIWHPFQTEGIFNPPWTFWLIWPLLKIPMYQVGLLRLLIVASVAAIVVRRGGKWWELLAVATSLPFVYLVANGNIDWLAGLAFLIPHPGASLILLSAKPQVGILAALAWLRKNGWHILLPILFVFALSLIMYGWWPAQALENIRWMDHGKGLLRMKWNISLFPWSVPLGLWLARKAWEEGDEFYGVSATLLLSPYFAAYTLIVWYILALKRRSLAAASWIGMWAWYFLLFRRGLWPLF